MTEFVYQLKLPPITDMLLDGIVDHVLTSSDEFKYKSVLAKSIIKPECLNINGFTFHEALLFYKTNGSLGRIHRDTVDPSKTIWGINWVYGGFGTLEYWDESDLISEDVNERIDEQGYPIVHYKSLVPARKKYMMSSPNAYLVNATQIHRPVGWGSRWAISLRTGTGNISWEDLVERFKDLIVCQN